MLMHSFTKLPRNHCHPLRALIVFHMDAFIHYCKNYKHKEDLCINMTAFCKSLIKRNVLIFSPRTSFQIISLLKEWMSQKGFISFIRIIKLNSTRHLLHDGTQYLIHLKGGACSLLLFRQTH